MKVQPLGRLFFAAAASAAIAAIAAQPAAAFLKPYVRGIPLSARLTGYAAVFAATFTLLSYIAGHVSFSLKAKGLEQAKGLAPALARLVLVAAVFSVPLLLAAPAAKKGVSLQSLMAESEKRAALEKEQGYNDTSRARLGALLGGK